MWLFAWHLESAFYQAVGSKWFQYIQEFPIMFWWSFELFLKYSSFFPTPTISDPLNNIICINCTFCDLIGQTHLWERLEFHKPACHWGFTHLQVGVLAAVSFCEPLNSSHPGDVRWILENVWSCLKWRSDQDNSSFHMLSALIDHLNGLETGSYSSIKTLRPTQLRNEAHIRAGIDFRGTWQEICRLQKDRSTKPKLRRHFVPGSHFKKKDEKSRGSKPANNPSKW